MCTACIYYAVAPVHVKEEEMNIKKIGIYIILYSHIIYIMTFMFTCT
jgi:hypothetical protein